MNITIIGNGNMAKGIGTRLVSGGHNVSIHAKDASKGQALVDELKQSVQDGAQVELATVGSALADVVVLAVPYGEVENIAADYDGFSGKIVVDITNPVDFNTFQLVPAAGTSGAQEIAAALPEAKVVKAFNTVFAGTLVAGTVDGKQLDVLVAGDDQSAKDTLREVIDTSDMRSIDVGSLANSRHLEGIALIHMSVQEQLGTGWMSAIKFIS